MVATTDQPLAMVGEFAWLKVVSVTDVGAFLDWGLPKDLLLPFGEQKYEPEEEKPRKIKKRKEGSLKKDDETKEGKEMKKKESKKESKREESVEKKGRKKSVGKK